MTDQTQPAAEIPYAGRKHRRGVRWAHWINGPLLLIMVWSGLRIYWADVRDPYGFGVGLIGWHWFDFLPGGINEYFGLDHRLARGMAYHFTFGWLFALNGLFFGLYAWRTGHWRQLLPRRRSWADAVEVVRRDLFLKPRRALPEGDHFNGAQRIIYTGVIAMGAGAVLTGLAIYKPTQLNPLTTLFGGYESARTIHFTITIGFGVFFALHLVQVARAGWGNFTAMVTGYQRLGPRIEPTVDLAAYRRLSRRAVLVGTGAVAVAVAGRRALLERPLDDGIPDVLRQGHETNEALWRKLSDRGATAPTFDRAASSMLRVNGTHGIDTPIDIEAWRLQVVGPDGTTIGRYTLDDIKSLPKVEYTVEHKCVEGWSHIVTWGGARFSDLAALHAGDLGADLTPFVGLATPDEGYYVSLDLASMLNPQTLLAYELEGEPLTLEHGAPLRLATPNKYGIKSIKRIGTITFADHRMGDYWFERGYDWYAQL